MPPLTLEQVLARSMRLPPKHAKHIAVPAIRNTVQNPSFSSGVAIEREDKGAAKLFSLIEKYEEAITAGRPSIHQSHNIIRNSQDLLSCLHIARRMGAWEDALRSFAESTKILVIQECEGHGGISFSLREGTDGSVGREGVTPSVAHVSVLLDTCAKAKQWHLVEQIGYLFRKQFSQVLVDAVSLLSDTRKTDVKGELYGWELALNFLRTRIPLEEQPVEAYNACLAACEKSLEWEAAFAIVRSMGPNAIQHLDPKFVSAKRKTDVAPVSATVEEESPAVGEEFKEDDLAPLHPPQPDVVTYATLLSVLEQSGRDALASEVLQRLPPVEKEEITASYAALIHVWSEQKYRNRRRRF